ncbi:MAG: tetratricopeptide repeat protein [Desulfovibrio sp.]|uniref:tetratricopeptide repeat protein n=1 Tax=Desulfovibrio sp. TaxID=885 RepID=UPI00135DAC4E|nr:tetratricopeptide repeat protein [Desulfovibrio sp.]MTJ91791.1 tetratricopeptide repeat protein [Desulfovibrio sp.]
MRRSKFSGVFSFSADWTASRSKTHFFVWELPDGAYAVQELNAAFQPVAEVERISAKSFLREFKAEPNILAMPVVTPDLSHFEARPVAPQPDASSSAPQPVRKTAEVPAANPGFAPLEMAKPKGKLPDSVQVVTGKADQAPLPFPTRAATGVTAVRYEEGQPPAAPAAQAVQAGPKKAYDLEAARKAKVVETKLRETFRQTLLRLKRPRERKAALLALEQLAHTKEGITPSHKHMFRDFGVRLRQNSQPDLALLFSRKAVELAPEDDHAHFNLARILCSLGMYDEAAAHVAAALSVSSEEPLYFKLLEHIRELKQARSAAKAARQR